MSVHIDFFFKSCETKLSKSPVSSLITELKDSFQVIALGATACTEELVFQKAYLDSLAIILWK